MTSPERLRPEVDLTQPPQSPGADVRLSPIDRGRLLDTVAQIATTEAEALRLFRRLDFPTYRLQPWQDMAAHDWWALVFTEFDRGIATRPYQRLISELVTTYGSNPVLVDLAAKTSETRPAPGGLEPASGARVQIIVRIGNEDELHDAAAVLVSLGLNPHEVWSTEHAVSFAVDSIDAAAVRRALQRTELGWTVVPPGQPDYPLRELTVWGPDGSRYRLADTPAYQTVASLAADVIEAHQASPVDSAVPTVVAVVAPGGEWRRQDPDQTLHDAGIRDGDSLRVGSEARAGGGTLGFLRPAVRRVTGFTPRPTPVLEDTWRSQLWVSKYFGDVLAAIRRISDALIRARALTDLIPHVHGEQRRAVLAEAVYAAETIEADEARAEALVGLAARMAHLPGSPASPMSQPVRAQTWPRAGVDTARIIGLVQAVLKNPTTAPADWDSLLAALTDGGAAVATRPPEFERVVRMAAEVWGVGAIPFWLTSPNGFLDFVPPIDALLRGDAPAVVGALESEAAGVYG